MSRSRPPDPRSRAEPSPRPLDQRAVPPTHGAEPAAYLPPSSDPPEGTAFLLLRRCDGGSFRQANPFALRREIRGLCGDIRGAKPIRSGALLVETGARHQTMTLLGIRTLLGHPVEPLLADRLNSVTGSVRSDQLLELSNAELLEELQDQGVCSVQRLASRDQDRWGPNPTIKLSFRGSILPQAIRCGYSSIAVSPWVPAPKVCRHCWQGGHDAKVCRRRQPTCGRCSGNHPTRGCEGAPSCPNCGAPHPAWDRSCEMQRQIRAYHREQQQLAREAHRHPRGPGKATWPNLTVEEWPPLAPTRAAAQPQATPRPPASRSSTPTRPSRSPTPARPSRSQARTPLPSDSGTTTGPSEASTPRAQSQDRPSSCGSSVTSGRRSRSPGTDNTQTRPRSHPGSPVRVRSRGRPRTRRQTAQETK